MAHPGGRPIEYNPEYATKVDEYLKQCSDEEFDWTRTDGDKSTSYEHRVKVKLPTTDGFARFLGVARSSLYEWEKKYEEFSDALEKIRIEQKQRLIDMGLSGDYNSTIAKLILSANHDMREKTDVTTGGESINPSPEERALANAALAQLTAKQRPNGTNTKNPKRRNT